MTKNTMKYRRLDAALRMERQKRWNDPIYWPLHLLLGLLVLGSIPAAVTVYRREREG
jgi:hypothetical protein